MFHFDMTLWFAISLKLWSQRILKWKYISNDGNIQFWKSIKNFFSLRFEGEILALLEMFNSIMKYFQLNNFAECNLYMQKKIQYFNKKKEK